MKCFGLWRRQEQTAAEYDRFVIVLIELLKLLCGSDHTFCFSSLPLFTSSMLPFPSALELAAGKAHPLAFEMRENTKSQCSRNTS